MVLPTVVLFDQSGIYKEPKPLFPLGERGRRRSIRSPWPLPEAETGWLLLNRSLSVHSCSFVVLVNSDSHIKGLRRILARY